VHEQTVLGLLGRIGLDEGSLACGPQLPFDAAAANARIAARLPPRRIDNNCSGKHAGMLAACVVNGWPIEGYERRDHPMQRAVASAMGRYLGMDLDAAPSGVDGCGLPTYGVPLAAIARGFAAAQSDPSFGRAQDAMAAHPLLVGGHGRFDTELLTVAGSRVTVKTGGAAVWAACLRDGGLGVAVKVESGTDSGLAPVALAVLRRLGVTWPAEALASFEEPPLQNWEGLVVGSTRVEADNLAAAFDSGGATS
jgi:L-asparaginase II